MNNHVSIPSVSGYRALVARGDGLKGLQYMAEALKMHRNGQYVQASTYTTIAGAFVDIGDYERASKYYQLAVSKDACQGIWFHANMYFAQNKLQQALEVVDARCNQSCERLCNQIRFQIFLLMGQLDKSEFYFSEWSKVDSADISRYGLSYELGYVYLKQGRIDESNEVFNNEINKLESLDYKNKWTYLNLSRIYAVKGNLTKAIEHLIEYSKLHFGGGVHDFILIDPLFENLRDDPQFKAIVRQAQEEKATLRMQVEDMIARGELEL